MARLLLALQRYICLQTSGGLSALANLLSEFWTNRLAATDPPLEISQTRIPEIPDQTEFLERWFEFHQGYRIARLADGTEQRIAVIGEPFKEVSPGFLPRTLDQLRAGVINDARRPENRLRRRRLSEEEQRPEEPQQSLDSALDDLLQDVSEDQTSQPVELPAAQTTSVPPPPTEPARPQIRPLNRGEARLQRARERFARVFGTREDLQQEDYESPLSTMYNRAYDRYNQAEERRATGTTEAPSLDGLSARERREIEEQLLWGVMRESASHHELETEGNVWSYTPRPPRPRQEVDNQSANDTTPADQQNPTSFASWLNAQNDPDSPTSNAINAAAVREQALRSIRSGPYYQQPSTRVPSHPSTTAGPSSASSTSASVHPQHGLSHVQNSISQITSELQRLRLASEALSTARYSMNPRFTPDPQSAQTLDSQPTRPAPRTDEQMTKTLACQVCYQQLADIAVLPCGHMVMCLWCADVVVPVKHSHLPIRPTKCPMCRKVIKQRFRIHMGSG